MIAIRMAGTQLEWDAQGMRFTNCDAANQFVKPTFQVIELETAPLVCPSQYRQYFAAGSSNQ